VAARIYLDILGARNERSELRLFLLEAEDALPENIRLLYLCRANYELGDAKADDLHWRMALAASRSSTDALSAMANYAAVMRWDDKAREICAILVENPQTEGLGVNGLLMLAYQLKEQKEIETTIRKLDAHEKRRSQ